MHHQLLKTELEKPEYAGQANGAMSPGPGAPSTEQEVRSARLFDKAALARQGAATGAAIASDLESGTDAEIEGVN